MAPAHAGTAISIPADVNMGNGNGISTGDDNNWAQSASPGRPSGDAPPRRSSRSRSPTAREGGDRGFVFYHFFS